MAYFSNTYIPSAGVIVCWERYGPEVARRLNAVMPDVKRWSDIAWVEWKLQCNNSPDEIRNIKYFLAVDVRNFFTVNFAEKVYNIHWNLELEPSQGPNGAYYPLFTDNWIKDLKPDDKDDEWGRAVLASPNVRGAAWFLISV